MTDTFPGTAADVTDDFVLGNCDYFTEVQLWPLRREINARIWLANFLEHELRHARYLLNSFLYLSNAIVEQILSDSFESLSREVFAGSASAAAALDAWRHFVDTMRVVVVRGEHPNPTDSGLLLSRVARDRLGVPEDRIFDVPDVLRDLDSGFAGPVVFIDDFVGSGDQFITTWHSGWDEAGGLRLADFAGQAPCYYLPVLATADGVDSLTTDCPSVRTMPGHLLGRNYSVFSPASLTWPDDLRDTAADFIRDASSRAGIPDTDGGKNDWRGYHKLGLTVGFAHGVPDATIPLYWWESDTWNPLKKRQTGD